MNDRQPLLSTICKPGATGLWQIVVIWLLLACWAVHGISINLQIGAVVVASPEETTEESKCEADIIEVLHKRSRVRFDSDRREGIYKSGRRPAAGVVRMPRLPVELVALHLVGAGINIRC